MIISINPNEHLANFNIHLQLQKKNLRKLGTEDNFLIS